MTLPKVVHGEGPLKCRLAIIGESPGEQEELTGRPFFPTAPSGHLLMSILTTLNIKREEVYLDNVVPIRPPGNKIKRLAEYGLTLEDFLPDFHERISKLDTDIIIACGETALEALTGEQGITKHRGSIYVYQKNIRYGKEQSSLSSKPPLVVPTFHPRYLIENWKFLCVVVEDFRKALRVQREGYQEPRYEAILRPTLSEVEGFLRNLWTSSRFAFDIEVVGGGQIACIGIGTDVTDGTTYAKVTRDVSQTNDQLDNTTNSSSVLLPYSAICIPFKNGYLNFWKRDEEEYVWHLLKQVFQSKALKIGQNMNYDLTKLLPFIGEPSPPWFDCKMAHHLLEADLPHTLAFQTSLHTWPVFNYYKDDPKDEEKDWKKMTSTEKLWEYNSKDVIVPLMLEEVYRKELKDVNMLNFFEGFAVSKLRVLWRIQQRGLELDEQQRDELLNGWQDINGNQIFDGQMQELLRKKEQLESVVGHPLNPGSNKQMVKFLYDDLKLPKQYDRKTHQLTANKQALEKLQAFHPHPALDLAVEIRELGHDISTYLLAEAESDGRLRGRYNDTGAATGRSSSKKNYEGRGLDLHNIPEQDRCMFKAKQGCTFIGRDLWQAEALIVANLSDCQSFLARLNKGKKLHKLIASWCFNKPEEKIDSNNRPGGEYYTGKRVGHGLNYGLGPILLAITLKCPIAQAKYYRQRYFTEAHEIEQWHRDVEKQIQSTRRLTTPFGRVRIFRDRMGESLYRKAYAHTPQSTIAELNHLAMIKMEYLLPEGAEILQEAYDAFLVETRDDLKEEVKKLFSFVDSKKFFINGKVVNVPGEITVNKRWMK